jgi:hypothetical protein
MASCSSEHALSKPVRLSSLVGDMQMLPQEVEALFDRETGEVVFIGPDMDDEDGMAEIIEADKDGRFVPLPDPLEIHNWSIMERFALEAGDPEVGADLLDAIRGPGAFRMFRRTVERLGLLNDWYKFRDGVYREIAAEWCREHNIEIAPEE